MINNTGAIWVFLASLCIAILMPTAALADTPRDIAKHVSPSVVLLVMEDGNGQPLAMGSGFVVREGVVATNLHVIEGAGRGYAKLADQKTKFDVRGVVASDPARDLVLLAVEGLKATPLTVGDSAKVAVGDEVYAMGNPRGLEGTFSAGIVSSIRKVGTDSLLQVTAPISPGSSGGPVVNSKGEVVGVAVATFKGGQNLNFAIPSQYLSAMIPSIKDAVALPEAGKALKGNKEKTILDNMGGRSTEGVVGSSFTWDDFGQGGGFSFSIKNKLREPIKNVYCLVIFYDSKDEPIDVAIFGGEGIVPGGLAKRVKGQVDESVEKLNTPIAMADMSRHQPPRPATGKIEFRILSFEIVSQDEPAAEGEEKKNGPGARDASHQQFVAPEARETGRQEDIEAALQESEKRLAEAVAKLAPAGNGPDLIESTIDGEFNGWDGDTIFKLSNGQIWQQVTYDYTYHYAFQPKVMIIKTYGAYKLVVDGVADSIFVKRIK